MGQVAAERVCELNAPERGRVIFVLVCTVGLEGGVELVARGDGGSWLRSKEDIVQASFEVCFFIYKAMQKKITASMQVHAAVIFAK